MAKATKASKSKSQDKSARLLSGRDLFTFDPTLFIDDEEADDEQYIITADDQSELLEVRFK